MSRDYLKKIAPETNMKFNFMRKIFMPHLIINGNFFEYAQNTDFSNPFILVSETVAGKFEKQLKALPFSQKTIVKHTGEPTEKLLLTLTKQCTNKKHDSLIGIGGGSTLDMVKGIKKELELPLIISPSTPSSGSETTPYALMINEKTKSKTLLRSPRLVPDVVVFDPSFLESIPLPQMGYFLFDILAHCLEGLASKMSSNFSNIFACNGIETVFRATKKLKKPYSRDALESFQVAGFLGGVTQGMASVGTAHSLAHYFGPKYNIPHAKLLSIFLPEVIRINASRSKVYEKMEALTGKNLKDVFALFEDIRTKSGIKKDKIRVGKKFSAGEAVVSIQKEFCSPTNPIRFDDNDFVKIFKNTLC